MLHIYENRVIFYDENKKRIDDLYGMFGIGFEVPSPSYSVQTEQVPGRGAIVVSKELNPRKITARFITGDTDFYHITKVQQFDLYSKLGNGKEFYVEGYHSPTNHYTIVWKCELGDWNPEIIGARHTTFEIPLTCYKGMAETLEPAERTFNTSTFMFENEGNQIVDPRVTDDFEIHFKGASTDLTIKNLTNGDTWSYKGTTTNEDTILIKGIRSMKNGNSIFGQTNKKLIRLAVGENEFSISGATGDFELKILSHFYYL